MPKVMLVEDDNNLREIYSARLTAEGYDIVAAHDGEEALALAVKERPDLIISDVMMPKISGFDMLDILRTTPETKNTKVIMMTALGQAEDRERADKLGADRYLVKSQVTLEDVIKVAHEVLNDSSPAPAAATAPVTTADVPVVAAPPVVAEPPAMATPPAADEPAAAPPATPAAPVATAEPDTPPVVEAIPSAPPAPTLETPVTPTVPNAAPITPDLTQTKEAETNGVEQQIQDFITNNPAMGGTPPATPAEPAAAPTVTLPTSAPAAPPTQDELAHPSAESTGDAVPEPPSHKKLVLTPTEGALEPAVDLNALLEKENLKEAEAAPEPAAPGTTTNPNDIAL